MDPPTNYARAARMLGMRHGGRIQPRHRIIPWAPLPHRRVLLAAALLATTVSDNVAADTCCSSVRIAGNVGPGVIAGGMAGYFQEMSPTGTDMPT